MKRNRLATASLVAATLAVGGLVFALTGPGGASRNAAIGAETTEPLTYITGTPVTSTGTAVGATTTATATCPASTQIISGGARVIGNTATAGSVIAGFPSKTGPGGVWTAQMALVSFSNGSAQPRLLAFAICTSGGGTSTTPTPSPTPSPTAPPVTPATFAFAAASNNRVILEPTAGYRREVRFTVTRTGQLDQPATIDWSIRYPQTTTSVSPASADDFFGVRAGKLAFVAYQTQLEVVVTILGDTTAEPDEVFLVDVTNGATTVTATTTIKDD